MTPDPALATAADVERAIRRRLLRLPDGEDPVAVAMAIVVPVLEAKDAMIAALEAQTGISPAPSP